MRRFAWAFAGRLCDKYPFLMCWHICRYFLITETFPEDGTSGFSPDVLLSQGILSGGILLE